ncbi:50S ribosomal protein L6 [Rhabdochlamydiaceae symbiont of Dictyostelium giganteum]|uniref:50S ribosomal protein L6 n=1 Tax=Rhabdochlamydiaceae symbiont of Dictyostelium giganteum TaxID=3342349 RepID=UPI003851469B
MTRFAKLSVPVPSNVEITVEGQKLHVKGPKGVLSSELPQGLTLAINGNEASILMNESVTVSDADHGLHRALFNNLVVGVSQGFEKKLLMIGVGYRATVEGAKLTLQVGKSHHVHLDIPQGVSVVVDKSGSITITGINKQVVGQFAATVRAVKPPEPYKGKGIRYEKEIVRKKAGKAAKSKSAG